MSGDAASSLQLAAGIGVAIAIVEIAGRRKAARWTVESEEELEDEFSRIAVLDIGGIVNLPKRVVPAIIALVTISGDTAYAQPPAPRSALPSRTVVAAAGGDIVITPFMHASVQIEHAGMVIQVDPAMGDVTKAKAADLVLVTDEHDDHFSPSRIAKVRKPGAPVVMPAAVQRRADGAVPAPIEVLLNDQRKTVGGIAIEAVAMYNVEHSLGDEPFHTKGRGNGYVITLGGKRLYLAGDTECVPEIKALQRIDVAFLPMNIPFTMPPSEAADCAKAFRPKIVIPYHYQGQNTDEFDAALKGSGIEVRELDWYPAVSYADVVAVPRPGKLVDVGGRKLHMNCTGSGQPTVILDGGAPSFAIDWFFVQPDIAKTNRVCSYDRAGSGWSEPSGHQETVDSAVADLHAALRSASEKPPFVLVGAGIGAFFARAYQLLYPEDVAGLVLVDGAHEDGFLIPVDGQPAPIWSVSAQQLRSAWELMRPPKDMPPPPMPPPQTDAPFDKLPPDLLTTRVTFESRLFKAMAATDPDQFLDMLERQRAALARLHEASDHRLPPLGNRPLIVLTAEQSPDPQAKSLQATLVSLSTNSARRLVPKSGAEIHLYEPSAVIRAIQDVVDAARRGSPVPR